MSFHVPEEFRIKDGSLGSDSRSGNNGAFVLPPKIGNRVLFVIASDGMDWEHVSVHCAIVKKSYTPTWDEMCHVKDLFWDEEDLVIQFHPARSQYVNFHSHTLHLWKPISFEIPGPSSLLVGPMRRSE